MRINNLAKNIFTKSEIINIAMGLCFMFICAKTYIPIKPVPITLHTMGAIIIALCFSKKEALSIICSFTALGFLGAPISIGLKNGFTVLLGPSGGYYFGMIAAVYFITNLRQKYGEDSYFKLFIYSMFGSVAIYTLGLAQLSLFVGADKALALGLYPFILTGIIKNIITTCVVKSLKGKRQS